MFIILISPGVHWTVQVISQVLKHTYSLISSGKNSTFAHSSYFVPPDPHNCLAGRSSMKWEVCSTLLHMTSSRTRTPDLLILNLLSYSQGYMLPHVSLASYGSFGTHTLKLQWLTIVSHSQDHWMTIRSESLMTNFFLYIGLSLVWSLDWPYILRYKSGAPNERYLEIYLWYLYLHHFHLDGRFPSYKVFPFPKDN